MYTVQNMQLFKRNSNCTETLPTLFVWFLPPFKCIADIIVSYEPMYKSLRIEGNYSFSLCKP